MTTDQPPGSEEPSPYGEARRRPAPTLDLSATEVEGARSGTGDDATPPEGLAPLLHLAGEDRAGDVAPPGMALLTAVVYRMFKAARLPDPVADALAGGEIDAVLHYSRRSAQAYLECATRAALLGASLEPIQLCLSPHTAEPLAAQGATGIRIAAQPNEAAMLALVDAAAVNLG